MSCCAVTDIVYIYDDAMTAMTVVGVSRMTASEKINLATKVAAIDTLTVSDTAEAILSSVYNDSATVTNTLELTLQAKVSSIDRARFSERLSFRLPLYITDQLTISDRVGTNVFVRILDTTTIVENVSATFSSVRFLVDVATLTDKAALNHVISVVESITTSDAYNIDRDLSFSFADTVVASESISIGTMHQSVFVDKAIVSDSTSLSVLASLELGETVIALDIFYAKNPDNLAWVLNTETGAGYVYDNYEFESICQVGDSYLAVSPFGLYSLTGNDDAGVPIDAKVATGYLDFGQPFVKRLDSIYVGYKSEGTLNVDVSVYDSSLGGYRYGLEPRSANAPRNSRFNPGKGLFGRYWKIEFSNEAGADFALYDIAVDTAISNRRL